MKVLRAIFHRLTLEIQAQLIGRRSLREIRFEKYKVAPRAKHRSIAERLFRHLASNLETAS